MARLGACLSSDNPFGEVQPFIDYEKYTNINEDNDEDLIVIKKGDFIELDIGRINLPFYSSKCQDTISFKSNQLLHCLIISDKMISIDCNLTCDNRNERSPRCQSCNCNVQSWFLIEANNIFSNSPNVKLLKTSHKLSKDLKLHIEVGDKYKEWFSKADIAYKERLGAGSIIYLRSIFEKITLEVGTEINDMIRNRQGDIIDINRLTFRDLLKKVDEVYPIIPAIYSENGYELFEQLSEIAHGNSDEQTALDKFESLRRLVKSVVDNVNLKKQEIVNNIEITNALNKIGISTGGEIDE